MCSRAECVCQWTIPKFSPIPVNRTQDLIFARPTLNLTTTDNTSFIVMDSYHHYMYHYYYVFLFLLGISVWWKGSKLTLNENNRKHISFSTLISFLDCGQLTVPNAVTSYVTNNATYEGSVVKVTCSENYAFANTQSEMILNCAGSLGWRNPSGMIFTDNIFFHHITLVSNVI